MNTLSCCRYLQLLSDLYCDLGMPAQSLPHIMECLNLCKKNNLPQHVVNIGLSRVLVSNGQ